MFFALVLAAPIVSGAMMSEPLKVSNIRSARTEALVVLHSLNALFAVFCLTQVVAAIGGARRVLTTDGLTYAEYARSGFFQLLTVSVLALGVIGVCRFAAGDAALLDRRFRWPLLATSLLTLAITGVAVRRLALYIDAFGVTEQRIVAMAGSLVVGATFVLVGWSITRGRVGIDVRGWSTAGALGCAVGAIALLHLIGPSRWAVNDGLRRVERGSDFRTNVAAGLGNFERTGFAAVVAEADTDSVATLFAWVNQKPQERVEHRRSICAEFRGLQSSRPRGWWQWHASDATARQLLTQNCPKAVG